MLIVQSYEQRRETADGATLAAVTTRDGARSGGTRE